MFNFIGSVFQKIASLVTAIFVGVGLVSNPANLPAELKIPTEITSVTKAVNTESQAEAVYTVELKNPDGIEVAQNKPVQNFSASASIPQTAPKIFTTPSGAIIDEFGNLLIEPKIVYVEPTPSNPGITNQTPNIQSESKNDYGLKFEILEAGSVSPTSASIRWKTNMPIWDGIYIDFYVNGKLDSSSSDRREEKNFIISTVPNTNYTIEVAARERNMILDKISTNFQTPEAQFEITKYTKPDEPNNDYFKINKNHENIELQEMLIRIYKINDNNDLSTPLSPCTRWDTDKSRKEYSICYKAFGPGIFVAGIIGDFASFETSPFSKNAEIIYYKAVDKLTGKIFSSD